MISRLAAPLAAVAVAVAVALAGCGDKDEPIGKRGSEPAAATASRQAPAAGLRAGLTAALVEHVYLAGIAIGTGRAAGFDSTPFHAAAATLDRNSVELSKALESVYGVAAARRFLALWRSHIGFFSDYARAQRGGDRTAAEEALARLDGYRGTFGAFVASINPNLPRQVVADALTPHIDTMTAAIRAAVKDSPKTFDRLRDAALHMPKIAALLSEGIAKQFPDRFAGG